MRPALLGRPSRGASARHVALSRPPLPSVLPHPPPAGHPHPQVALTEQLVQEVWSGPAAVVLNPSWSGAPREYEAVVRSFEVAYSFLPISVKVGGRSWGWPLSGGALACGRPAEALERGARSRERVASYRACLVLPGR
jgi:hypothetical protein